MLLGTNKQTRKKERICFLYHDKNPASVILELQLIIKQKKGKATLVLREVKIIYMTIKYKTSIANGCTASGDQH